MSSVVRRLPLGPATPAQLPDEQLLRIVQAEPLGSRSREQASEELVRRYRGMVRTCAQRYKESPEPAEELMQAGYVGLLKAISNFDPSVGDSLAAYAKPCISGEIKRHFRDRRWDVHVRRSAQELRQRVRAARGELMHALRRAPTDAELTAFLGIGPEDLLDARRAELAFQAASLSAPLGREVGGSDPGTLEDVLGYEDPQIENTIDMEAVWSHLGDLPPREQELLLMRYYGNMTQSEIGSQLGISQMHVSRLQAHALGYLRARITGTR